MGTQAGLVLVKPAIREMLPLENPYCLYCFCRYRDSRAGNDRLVTAGFMVKYFFLHCGDEQILIGLLRGLVISVGLIA